MEKVKKTVLTALAAAAMACLTAGLVFTLPAKTVFAAEVEVRDETTLQSAITNANAGDTIKLMADVTASITVPEDKEITLDLNGFTLTDDGNHTITNYGKLTIVDNSAEGDGTVDNVTHARGALFNLGEATLLGGDYTRSKENGSSATESGGNSWYVIKNLGYLTIGTADGESDVSVSQNGRFSSMITNGYFDNDNTGDHEQYYSSVTTDDKVPTLTIYGGTFSGGINTVKNDNHSVANIIGGTFTNVSQAVVLNWNNLSISGGEFEVDDQAIAAIITSYANTGYNNGKTAITDGEFHGEIIADASPDSVTYSISGGTFTEDIPEAYIAEGSMFYPTENGYAVADQAKAEAELSEGAVICGNKAYADFDTAAADGVVAAVAHKDGIPVGYTSLQDTINAAENGEMVTLLQDTTANVTIPGGKSITLDLNGKTLSAASATTTLLIDGATVTVMSSAEGGSITNNSAKYAVNVINGADVTLEGITLTSTNYALGVENRGEFVSNGENASIVRVNNSTVEGEFAGAAVWGLNNEAEVPTLIANNSTFTGGWYGISGNGTYHYTNIQLTNCTVKGTLGSPSSTNVADLSLGIYHPQDGTLIINGGSVTGVASGIEMRSGNLTVRGDAVITATAENYSATANGSGNTIVGAAIALSQHSTNLEINASLESGTFNGVYAVVEVDVQDPEVGATVDMTITGGTYNGQVASEHIQNFIYGGNFSVLPDATAFAEGLTGELGADGRYEVVLETEGEETITTPIERIEAQANVRSYLGALGLSVDDLSRIENTTGYEAVYSAAQAAVAAYNAILTATTQSQVADNLVAALDAVDAYKAALDAAKEDAIDDLEKAAAANEEEGTAAVAVPTYALSAINAAKTPAEIKSYVDAATNEITELKEQCKAAAEQVESIKKVLEVLQGTDGESGIAAQIAAIEALLGKSTDSATASTIFGMLNDLKSDVASAFNDVAASVDRSMAGVERELDALSAAIEALSGGVDEEALLAAVKAAEEAATAAGSKVDALETLLEGKLDSIDTAITEVNGAIDSVATAQDALKTAVESYKSELTTTVEGLEAAIESIREDVKALTDASAEDRLAVLEQLTKLQTTADGLASAIEALESGTAEDLTALASQLTTLGTSVGNVESVVATIAEDGATSTDFIAVYVCLGVSLALAAATLVLVILKKRS